MASANSLAFRPEAIKLETSRLERVDDKQTDHRRSKCQYRTIMPAATSPNPNQLRAGSHPPDDLDRLLDYDNAVEDFLRDIPVGNGEGGNVGGPGPQTARDEDQEVQVKKKRKPLPKLDENR